MTFSPVLEEGEAQEGEYLFSGDRPMVSGKVGISLTGDFICIYPCMSVDIYVHVYEHAHTYVYIRVYEGQRPTAHCSSGGAWF